MQRVILTLFVFFSMVCNVHAVAWVKLNDNKTSKLSIDRQSVLQKDTFKRAWVKVEYKTPQKNIDSPDIEYELAKLLWYFDCNAQKSATSQVFQYLNNQLVYSAGIDVKNAVFIEPVPETDLDRAMRYACSVDLAAKSSTETKAVNKPEKTDAKTDAEQKKEETKPTAKDSVVKEPAKPETKSEPKTDAKTEPKETKKPDAGKLKPAEKSTDKSKEKEVPVKADPHAAHWTYEGKEGPENWGKLKPEFATCDTGRNQSPIDINITVDAALKPLRGIQKQPAKDIVNNGHTVQANFRDGNMLLVDDAPYQMKQVHFHAPSENMIRGKSFPLEAHFVHADKNGNLAVIGVMFNEGKANAGLEKLWTQLPNKAGEPIPLSVKVPASEMIPANRDYFRFSGSLTTPPCTEGVRWLVMKTPMTASKEQIEAFKQAIKHENSRPVQPLNGRLVVE